MPTTTPPNTRRRNTWRFGGTLFLALLILLVLFWDWNWFKPLVEARASAALGRPVQIQHMAVRLARHPLITLTGLSLANPPGFEATPMATLEQLAVQLDAGALLDHRISIDSIRMVKPLADLHADAKGLRNWQLQLPTPGTNPWMVSIDQLLIEGGDVRFVDAKLKADFRVAVRTQANNGGEARLLADADGRYADQPIKVRFSGGSALRLREPNHPYPIDLHVANGKTLIALTGTVLDPLHLAGAEMHLDLRGDDLEALYALTAIPFPRTAPYHLAGKLDYTGSKLRFAPLTGTLGSSDVSGSVLVTPRKSRPLVEADLVSKKVLLADLAGFIGGTPGASDAATNTAKLDAERARKAASGRILPSDPINLPKLRAADVHLKYHGERIEGGRTPLDDLTAGLHIIDGTVKLAPLEFGIGDGHIALTVFLDGRDDKVEVEASADVRRVDISKLLKAAGPFKGSGTLGGVAKLKSSGRSVAEMLGHGNGELKLFMNGGDLSALLLDIAGLDFGNAVVSALGIPSRAKVRCLASDFALADGQLDTRLFVFDTTSANVVMDGGINLRDETLSLKLRTEPKRLNIGRFKSPININGTLQNPRVLPDLGELGARGGAAVLLGALLTPLAALLPTIQLGLGEDHDCKALMEDAHKT